MKMLSRFRYILLFSIVLFSALKTAAQISMPDNVYVGAVKHYWVDSIIGSESTYTWKIDHVIRQIGPVNLFSIKWNTTGAYFLEVQKTSADKCASEVKSGWVYVIAAPVLGTITSQTNVTCFNGNTGSVTVAGLGENAPYEYKLGEGSYQSSGTFNSLTAGNYIVTVRDAMLSTFDVPVTIIQPTSALTVSTLHTNIQCYGEATGTATAIVAGGTIPYSYSWNSIPTQIPATISGLVAGTYLVKVTDLNGCTAESSATIVSEKQLPNAAFTFSLSGLNTYSFTNASTNAMSNSWDFGDGQISTSVNPIHVYATSGTYTVKLTVSNSCGTDLIIRVITIPELEFFNGFSPNGDGQNDEWNIPILNYFPFNSVLIINRWGSEVWKANNYDNKNIVWTGKNMKGDNMPDGTYYYIINYGATEKRGWVFIKR